MTSTVKVEVDDEDVAVMTLDRPSKLNSMSMALVDEVNDHLTELRRSTELRALIVTGSGRAFCAGADVGELNQLLGPTAIEAVDGVRRYNAVAAQLWDFPVPTIAAVNGPAVGGGAAVALLCDLRLMAEGSYLKVNQLERGIVPDMGATFLLPLLIGHAPAVHKMMMAEAISPDEAVRWGLATELAPAGDVVARAVALARKLTEWPPVAVRSTVQAIRATTRGALADAMEREAHAQAHCSQAEGFIEGVARFTGAHDG
jgi:enoyl-CoA hydratase/carnithine racemase